MQYLVPATFVFPPKFFFLVVLMLPNLKTIAVYILIKKEISSNYNSSLMHSGCSYKERIYFLTLVCNKKMDKLLNCMMNDR